MKIFLHFLVLHIARQVVERWAMWGKIGGSWATMGRQGQKISTDTRAAIVDDLKAGKAITEIATRHGVAPSTVSLYREKHKDELPKWKRRTREVLMGAAETLAEQIAKQAANGGGNIQQNALSLGILSTKITTELSDNPALLGVVEHRHEIGQGLGGWLGNSVHQNAPQAEKAAEVVEIEAEVTESGGSGEQCAAGQQAGQQAGQAGQQAGQQGAGGVENCAPSPPNMD